MLHRLVGEALEQTAANRLDELAPILAQHFYRAGDDLRALKYFTLAGKAAQRAYANAEAAMQYRKAVEIARKQPGGCEIDESTVVELNLRLGRSLELAGQFTQAIDHYGEMEADAVRCDNPRMQLAALIACGTILSTPTSVFNQEKAHELSDRALKLARQLGDRAAETKVLWNLLLLYYFTGNIDQARKVGEESLAMARALNLTEQIAYTLNDLASYVYTSTGEMSLALSTLEEAEGLWERLENQPMLSDSLTNAAMIHFLFGDFQVAMENVTRSFSIADSTGNLWGKAYSLGVMGFIFGQQGQISKALNCMQTSADLSNLAGFTAVKSIGLSQRAMIYARIGAVDRGLALAQAAVKESVAGAAFWLPHSLGSLSLCQTLRGEIQAAEQTFQQAQQTLHEASSYLFTPMILSAAGELFLVLNRAEELAQIADRYLHKVRQFQSLAFVSDGLYYLGEAYVAQQKWEEARVTMVQALASAEQRENLYISWRIARALTRIETKAGQLKAAAEWRRQMDEFESRLIGTIDDADLVQTFKSYWDERTRQEMA